MPVKGPPVTGDRQVLVFTSSPAGLLLLPHLSPSCLAHVLLLLGRIHLPVLLLLLRAASSEPRPPPHGWTEELVPCGERHTRCSVDIGADRAMVLHLTSRRAAGGLEGGASLALTFSWWRRLELGQPERGGLGRVPESSVTGSVTFCPLTSCGNNCDNRCSTMNQMSLRCGFPKYVPQVQTSQNRQCDHPQGRACLGAGFGQVWGLFLETSQGLSGRGLVLSRGPCSWSEILRPWSISGMRDRDGQNTSRKRAGGLLRL